MLGDTALHPLARLDEQLLLLPAEDADPDDLVGPQGDLPPAPGAAPNTTVVTQVTHPVSELGLQADLTRVLQLHSRLLLEFCFVFNLILKVDHLQLFFLI